MMSTQDSQIVPYVAPSVNESNHDVPVTSVGIFFKESPVAAFGEPPEVARLKTLKNWRKRKQLFTGVGMGAVLLVFLGPFGPLAGVAGGVAGWYATKNILKRREKKVVDRLMAMQYPLVYNEHAVFA
eukprot:scaffold6026_cov163-Amphora_coffeaeformis.AAC.11